MSTAPTTPRTPAPTPTPIRPSRTNLSSIISFSASACRELGVICTAIEFHKSCSGLITWAGC